MRTDQAPLTDARVRQAMALSLDRPGMVAGAARTGTAAWPTTTRSRRCSRSTDTSVPQRMQDIAKAKQLLAAAGHPNGFNTTLVADIYQEIAGARPGDQGQPPRKIGHQHQPQGRDPDPVLRQVDVRQLGLARRHDEPGRLRRPRRAQRVPQPPLTSHGTWNAARFKNPTYDKLVKQYVAAHRPADPEARSPARSRPSCWRRRRSSSPTSSTGCCADQANVARRQPDVDLADLPRQGLPLVKHRSGGCAAAPRPRGI